MSHTVDITKPLQIKLREDSSCLYDVEIVHKVPPKDGLGGWMVVKAPALIPFIFDFPYDTRDPGYAANGNPAWLSNKELEWYSVYTDSLGKPVISPYFTHYSEEECVEQIESKQTGSNCLGYINTKTGETVWV